MRPDRPPVETDADLARAVDSIADRFDGRLGVFLGVPRGPDEFDVLHRRNADETFVAASTIKLPILYALYETYDGRLDDLGEPRPIAAENRVGGSGVLHLFDDPTPSLEDLARAMIAISDNAATNQLIDELGAERIEAAATRLGMADTRLRRKLMATLEGHDFEPLGEQPEGEPANATTPMDCARFFADLVHEATLSAPAYERLRVPLDEQKDASLFARYLPYGTPIAHKTGGLPTAALDAGVLDPPDADPSPLAFAAFATEAENGGDASDVVAAVGEAAFERIASR
ncbi:beta-lactamase class A [Halorubrum aquaticum]|uniref:Beta-lactamase class A n=1 Tax=Halorubrum aquaticum TaxID=387340 RepID=A0A1I2Z3G0_9EURY|nr:serine hydrolase [Halorubrum aquaticum]SFH32407.1 beta-lactamase class A [Halorubrum aquaticum]